MTAPRRTAFVILNPTSGSGAGAGVRGEIERELRRRGVEFDLAVTEAPGHAEQLAARAAASRPDFVVAAGGDGTAHEVANGLLREGGGSALAVLPVGTGNDFVKCVPGLRPRRRAYDTIAAGAITRVDAGYVSWEDGAEFFINGMGTGIDVEVVRGIERRRHLPGAFVYLSALWRALRRFRPIPLRLSMNGEVCERRALMIAVCNGRCIGGAFRICPDARVDDGRFDVCIVAAAGRTRILRALPRVLRGTHARLPEVSMTTARDVMIDSLAEPPLYFQLDGELRRAATASLRVELRPGALAVATDARTRA